MEQICDMMVVRTFHGPASLLAELVDDKGAHHVAIVFYEQFHDHGALNESLHSVLEFLQSPMLAGIAPLPGHVPHFNMLVISCAFKLSGCPDVL